MITARNVTYALNGVPQASDAYEAGEKILCIIKESEETAAILATGKKKVNVFYNTQIIFWILSHRNLCLVMCQGAACTSITQAVPAVKVLRGLSVSVSPGETLALVGSSGSGKSTLVSLIERFYSPTVGMITLDGEDISGLDLKWLRSHIGYVQQEPVLFDANIADNIRYGDLVRDVPDEEIMEVAKACNIHNFIQSLPQVSHYETTFYLCLCSEITLCM